MIVDSVGKSKQVPVKKVDANNMVVPWHWYGYGYGYGYIWVYMGIGVDNDDNNRRPGLVYTE